MPEQSVVLGLLSLHADEWYDDPWASYLADLADAQEDLTAEDADVLHRNLWSLYA